MDVRFKNFQWITASVSKHPHDPRPESYRVNPDTIEVQEEISSRRPDERRALLESSPHFVESYETLKTRNEAEGISLGIIRPKEITRVRLQRRSAGEKAEWEAAEKELLKQQSLFERPPLPIDFPEVRFLVKWVCADERCSGHEMGLEEWGLHELYRKHRKEADCDAKVIDAMKRRLDSLNRDIFLFLGNFRTIMYNFGLMASYDAPRKRVSSQMSLLGE